MISTIIIVLAANLHDATMTQGGRRANVTFGKYLCIENKDVC